MTGRNCFFSIEQSRISTRPPSPAPEVPLLRNVSWQAGFSAEARHETDTG